MMAPRASSPAASENEFDLTTAIFGNEQLDETSTISGADIGVELNIRADDGSDDEIFIAAQQAASNRKASNLKGKTVKKGGAFQMMGLSPTLLKAITRKGFTIPTPIQRKTIPLLLDGQDVVGMARTGSGKTAAFVIPMIERLKTHSAKFGARAVILSPSRELALQTLRVVREFGHKTDLRSILLVGGDSLEEQFNSMTTNPDIIIATPGRFLHLKVEMGLDLSSVQYIVFDEADRLFEMGFAVQLSEILHALPTSRQTLLFSATLPKSLVEFARAGLQEPKLIRLDADSKISPDLENAFFIVKTAERDGALLHILETVIQMPTGETESARKTKEVSLKNSNSKKRKRGLESSNTESPTAHSTIVFAATKHRVEYLATLLRTAGYSVSYVYGSLDQTARKMQVQDFRLGVTNILVVTDVAARGIDLPALANVINYDMPSQPKIFVHRVGRTARAGRKGWSYNLVRESDVPYVLDLQVFLGKRLTYHGSPGLGETSFATDIVVGGLVQDQLEPAVELASKLLADDSDVAALETVAERGETQYIRSRNPASHESVQRAKQLLASGQLSQTHLLFGAEQDITREREKMLARVSSFRPAETVFEIGKRGNVGETVEILRKRRQQIDKRKQKSDDTGLAAFALNQMAALDDEADDGDVALGDSRHVENSDLESDPDSELEVSISQPGSRATGPDGYQSESFYMAYTPREINQAEDRAYGVHSGSYKTAGTNFVEAARGATMDLANDEVRGFAEASKARGQRWDKRAKKYVARVNDDDGSRGTKKIIGESGVKLPASLRSGRFDDWRRANKIGKMPRTGEMEAQNKVVPRNGGRHYKHKGEQAPKEADRYRDDYHVQKKRVHEAREKRIGKFKDHGAKNELRDVDAVRKQRNLQEKRRDKNARPSKKRKL